MRSVEPSRAEEDDLAPYWGFLLGGYRPIFWFKCLLYS